MKIVYISSFSFKYSLTRFIGVANPIPIFEILLSGLYIAWLIPIISPFVFNNGPPDDPGLIAASVCINKYFLRLECESELKNLLLKYKNNFLLKINSDREMRKVLNNVIKTLVVIFRSVLRLHDRQVPYRAADIIENCSEFLSFNKIVMTKLAAMKYENDRCNRQELLFMESELLKDIQSILKQIDAMHF